MTVVYLCSQNETVELGTAEVEVEVEDSESGVILRDVSFTADSVANAQTAALLSDVKFYQDILDRERGWTAEYKKHRDEMADALEARTEMWHKAWETNEALLDEREDLQRELSELKAAKPVDVLNGDDHFSESWRRINQDRINLSAANSVLREENKRLATELNMIADIISQTADRSDAREDPF